MVLRFDLDAGSAAERRVSRWWRTHRKSAARRMEHAEHGQGAWFTWVVRVRAPGARGELLQILDEEDVPAERVGRSDG